VLAFGSVFLESGCGCCVSSAASAATRRMFFVLSELYGCRELIHKKAVRAVGEGACSGSRNPS